MRRLPTRCPLLFPDGFSRRDIANVRTVPPLFSKGVGHPVARELRKKGSTPMLATFPSSECFLDLSAVFSVAESEAKWDSEARLYIFQRFKKSCCIDAPRMKFIIIDENLFGTKNMFHSRDKLIDCLLTVNILFCLIVNRPVLMSNI